MDARIRDENHLKTLLEQLKFRVSQGNGDALYEIGVGEDGTPVGFTEPELMNVSTSKYFIKFFFKIVFRQLEF